MNYSQSDRSKMWMTEALYKLMEMKPYASITIKEITETAGVSRLTFYRNFSSKENILEQHFQTLFQEFMEHISEKQIDTMRDIIELMYSLWLSNKAHIKLLLKNNLGDILYAPFSHNLKALLKHLDLSGKINEHQIAFISGGLYTSMLHWLDYGENGSEKIADSILDILKLPE